MKKTVIGLCLMSFFGFATTAQAEVKVSGSLDIAYYSDYIGAISGQNIYDHSVFQQSLLVNFAPANIYAMVWSSYSPRGGFDSDFGDEVDWVIGITRSYFGVDFDLSYTYYDLYDIGDNDGDLHGIFLVMDFPQIISLNPYLKIECDIPFDNEILDGGLTYRFGASYDLEFSETFGSRIVTFDASIAGHDGAYGTEPELISSGKLAISTTFNLWKVNVTPEVSLQERFDKNVENGGMTQSKVWYGIKCCLPF